MNDSALEIANNAIFHGDVALLREVVSAGLDLHQSFAHGNTLLRNACSRGGSGPLELLLELGADPNQRSYYHSPVDKRFEAGFTPLMYAHSVEAASALVAHGADVNAASDAGITPLMRARCEAVARVLVEHGAALDAVNNLGTTALMFAAKAACADVVSYLVSQGANVNARQLYRRGRKMYTALRFAKEGLAEFSKINPGELGGAGERFLENYRKIVMLLESAGAV